MDPLFCGQFSHHPGITDLCHPSQLFELLSPQTGRRPCRAQLVVGASVHIRVGVQLVAGASVHIRVGVQLVVGASVHIRVGVQLVVGASVHSLTLPLPLSDFTRMQDIPEEIESRDGEPVASES